MPRKPVADIEASRLPADRLRKNFSDIAPTLDQHQALIAAQRCFYCFDAPCTTACPTGIDIASFIRSIATDDRRSAAQTILDANIFGGSCARVCPTEVLCEGACVRNGGERIGAEGEPVQIGALQRYATDWVYAEQAALFERGADSDKRVAVLGAGPAGLACAHALALRGHRVDVYDPKSKPGGLNEYGIAAYKVPDFAQAEVEWLLGIGGIELIHRPGLTKTINLEAMAADYDAVFVAVGLAGVAALNIPGEHLPGVRNAVDFIADLRQSEDLSDLAVGRRVVVIGGGNTAIDAAIQSKRMGAEAVTLVYRRGAESMSATGHEQEFAKSEGVTLLPWAQPRRFLGEDALTQVEFERTALNADGQLIGTGEGFRLHADWALKAIGQRLDAVPLAALDFHRGKIKVDADFATSMPGIWAGGDCAWCEAQPHKQDLTVQAVEDGKRAAIAIDRALRAEQE